jgi:uncharacterized protein
MDIKKNFKKSILIVLVIFIIIFIVYKSFFYKDNNLVCINDKCIDVLVADNSQLREKGLMYRKELCSSCGMLFIFDKEDKHGFWMKNTLIPLDMIWINKDNLIVDIIHAETCLNSECISYYPKSDSLYVLEVNFGYSINNNISVGDIVEMKIK